jgi:CubicO group peptidase (beta-lactamase class C family)
MFHATRRKFLIGAGAVPLCMVSSRGDAADAAAPSPTESERLAMMSFAEQYRKKFRIPGLSVAISRHGRIVYREAFGLADLEAGEPATPSHLFRIASVTKPITSTAIYTLIERGKVKLDDKVFAPDGWLRSYCGDNPSAWLQEITVQHLLTHTSGGWPNDTNDPMFRDPSISQNDLISWVLANQPPANAPGTQWAYSNFGYCLLGRVIEKASAMPYPEFVTQRVLLPSDVTEMRIAGNTRADRVNGEVAYYGPPDGRPYGMNVARMDSHGGWIASATDLVKFVMHVDGFNDTESLLMPRTIQTMTSTVTASAGSRYASGWAVNTVPNWWHIGSLPGTTAIVVRTANGLCWAALANARSPGSDGAIDRMMWNLAKAVPAWQA